MLQHFLRKIGNMIFGKLIWQINTKDWIMINGQYFLKDLGRRITMVAFRGYCGHYEI